MEDEENQDILVDLKNFNCKKCGKFPKELTIYICQNKINNKECGFNYCFHLMLLLRLFYVFQLNDSKIYSYHFHKNRKIYKNI